MRFHLHPAIGIWKVDFGRGPDNARLNRERQFLNGPEDGLFA
jgi:hypothetical protein